jgi:hypothetical protein
MKNPKPTFYLYRTFKAFQKAVTVPDGFSMTIDDNYDDYTKSRYVDVILKNATVGTTIRFSLRMDKIQKWDIRGDRGIPIKALKPYLGKSIIVWSGHVNYTHNGSTFSYDRLGVEDSFYNGHRYDKSPNEQITEQLARIEESRGRIDNSVRVPSPIDRLIDKDRLEKTRIEFKTKKNAAYSSHPGGFGTMYTVMKQSSRFSNRAPKEIEEFFGYSPLYIHTDEMD